MKVKEAVTLEEELLERRSCPRCVNVATVAQRRTRVGWAGVYAALQKKSTNPCGDEMQDRCVGPLMYFHPTVKTESVNVSPD